MTSTPGLAFTLSVYVCIEGVSPSHWSAQGRPPPWDRERLDLYFHRPQARLQSWLRLVGREGESGMEPEVTILSESHSFVVFRN